MKVARPEESHSSPKNRHETIVCAWQSLGRVSAGADELALIQESLGDETISPAEIARELAQAGVQLRHPEVINCDARWRAAQLERQASTFAGISPLQSSSPLELKDAEAALAELERLRCAFAEDEITLSELKRVAVDARTSVINHTNDSSLSPLTRAAHAEIAEWLRMWLETPGLFAQWLDLRKASGAFKAQFPDF